MKLFETCVEGKYIRKFFCGIRYSKKIKPLYSLVEKFSTHESFDCREFDHKIAEYIENNHSPASSNIKYNRKTNQNEIMFLATEYYDSGGHTELAKSLCELLAEKYSISTFLVNCKKTYKRAPKKIASIEQFSELICSTSLLDSDFDLICNKMPKVLFSLVHVNDAYGVALLAMVHKFTHIKIIYLDHGSHYPALGFSFADLSLEGKITHYVAKHYRGFDKCCYMPLPNQKKEDVKYYSEAEIARKRKELGIHEDDFFTLSGASSYKFFEQNTSIYFETIKSLLQKEPKLKHLLITSLTKKEKNIINTIFKNSPEQERLLFHDLTPDYDILFQACDVFIDSFPIGSSLAQVDLMKWKKPTVCMINRKNSLFSFHENFPEDYEYLYDNSIDLENGVLKLLHSRHEQKKATEQLYEHFLQTSEGNSVKQKYVNLIENADNLEPFYQVLDETLVCSFVNIK